MNLLKETISELKKSGHSPTDIVFIGSEESGHTCTWEEFQVLADQEYDSGYGGQEVAMDLIIVFSDGSKMWRDEYDGSESWAWKRPFKAPETTKPIRSLFVPPHRAGWMDLEDIDEEME
jgi:hypothetical protein